MMTTRSSAAATRRSWRWRHSPRGRISARRARRSCGRRCRRGTERRPRVPDSGPTSPATRARGDPAQKACREGCHVEDDALVALDVACRRRPNRRGSFGTDRCPRPRKSSRGTRSSTTSTPSSAGSSPTRRSSARRPRAVDRPRPPDGRLGLDAADRVPLARTGVGEDASAGGHRAAGAAPGRGGQRHAGLPVPQGRRRRTGPPTILFDEIDTVFGPKARDNEDVRGLLNAGHRKGAVAGRCVVRGKMVETVEYPRLLRRRAGRPRRPARHHPDPLGHHPDAPPRAERAGRAFRRRVEAPAGHALRDRLAAWAATVAPDAHRRLARDAGRHRGPRRRRLGSAARRGRRRRRGLARARP